MKKQLLVGSIFSNDSETQRRWFHLQYQFLAQTTRDFDRVVVSSKGPSEHFSQTTTTLVPDNTEHQGGRAHLRGLELLIHYFLEHKDRYEYFLILDSDAFPVRDNWLDILVSKMEKHEVALPVRTENLELRLHASILFAKPEAIQHLIFKSDYLGDNLLGEGENDIHIPYYQHEARDRAFALMRSNVYNVHPLAHGIYFDCFYHHCCGSRTFVMRSEKYWDHLPGQRTEEILSSPQEFINRLRGFGHKI